MVSAATVLTRNQQIRWTNVGDDIVLMDPVNETYFQLNATASLVWELADGRSTISDMTAELTSEYDCDPATAEADIIQLVNGLITSGHLRESGADTPAKGGDST